MADVSIIINGVRYDAVEDTTAHSNSRCDFYKKGRPCCGCIIGMDTCERLIGVDGIFKKSTKSFER
jgi:hypothetical protein